MSSKTSSPAADRLHSSPRRRRTASPRTGDEITGTDRAEDLDGVQVVHAGTALRDGSLVTAGGRVLAVTAHGDDVAAARERAYEGVGAISFAGAHARSDIAAGVR